MNMRTFRVLDAAFFSLKLCGVLALLLAGSVVRGQVVSFPDPNTEQAVRDTLGIPVGNITQADMLTLTNLNASGRSITNLSGLDKGFNLKNLDVSFNLVTNLSPLAGLTNLVELHAAWSRILDIS